MSFAILMKALDLASAEIPVFPCAADKRPTCAHGFKDATCEPEAIRNLWCDHPGPLIGVPTGAASGIFVLDVDSAKHIEADQWLERHAPYLPETREHRTKSGGLHILFKHRDGLKNTASKIARGIDTRGEGGYVIWWPAAIAQSADGRNPPLADVPEWIVEALTPPPPKIILPRDRPRYDGGDGMPRVCGIVAAVATARQGERNALTFWAACRIRDMILDGAIDGSDARQAFDALARISRHTGLDEREISNTIKSALVEAR